MSCYTGAALELFAAAGLLLIVGAFDVWQHFRRDPKNGASVNTGKTPVYPPRSPR